MNAANASISRPAITKLLIGAVLMLGALGLFIALAADASAGGDVTVTVNSTANIHAGGDTGDCDTSPDSGTCTLGQAINTVNAGDADIINFHPPVFSKQQPGVIELCLDEGDGYLPEINRDVLIDSKDSGVILDGGTEDDDCGGPAPHGIQVIAESNGLDFELNGGKNFTIRNIACLNTGIHIFGGSNSLGTIVITGVIIENIDCDAGIRVHGTNLESLSITNSEISANDNAGIAVTVNACDDIALDCKLTDSVIDISGNRVKGGASSCCYNGVNVFYEGIVHSGSKITASVSQNEVINGSGYGVAVEFFGCGEGGLNVHVDENEDINGDEDDGVHILIGANRCFVDPGGLVASGPLVAPGNTSDSLEVIVTVNGNGDIENHDNDQDGVDIDVFVCCEESDSSATVEVSDNGRITGEGDGVDIDTSVCCGDDNVSNVSVNGNDEITGEGANGIEIDAFAGSSDDAGGAGAAGQPPTGFDSDDNVCTITIDGNNEIDGVGSDGVEADCFAGTLGFGGGGGAQIAGPAPLSSGDGNVATINVTNNSDIDGDGDGVRVKAFAGSVDGEADDNRATGIVSGNGEITGDEDDGIDADVFAGSPIDEGDDNATEITVENNSEAGGNGGHGMELTSFAGGETEGSEGNGTAVTVAQNGDTEGAGDEYGDGIHVESDVCCDPDNTNAISISNNAGEITGHDDDGIEINTCCSVNTISITDNAGNIRGGDGDGLQLDVCYLREFDFGAAGEGSVANYAQGFIDCLEHSRTHLTVTNNSFSDSEDDGIDITGSVFDDDNLDFKSVISNNIVEGNGGDGIDVNSGSGLNIGPGNEVYENGTSPGDNGIEIDWYLAGCIIVKYDTKLLASHNTITQNGIYDNFGLGIDLVGYDADGTSCLGDSGFDDESTVGCVPFPETAISPNDCISFPELETQSGDKLIGTACSECTIEVFWADNDPANQDGHGEGAEYIVSGEADVDGDFSIELPCDLGAGDLTATATDKLKNTSEFAANLVTLGTLSCATDTPVPTDTPDATDVPVPTSTPEPVKVCGDVNMDGSVNSVDATLILQLKAGLIDSVANESSADVDNDGNVTSIDASLILQATAGIISESALTCP